MSSELGMNITDQLKIQLWFLLERNGVVIEQTSSFKVNSLF